MALFPITILAVYGILFVTIPDKALLAAKSSGNIFLNMLIPLSLVFVLMLLINLFLKPARVAKFLGKGSGVKGITLSAAASIISTGPIYAWYPLLKDLREKGAGDFVSRDIPIQQGRQAISIAYHGHLLRLAVCGYIDHTHGFSVGCYRILRGYFHEGGTNLILLVYMILRKTVRLS